MKEEICYFCLECLGTNFYISALELKDGTGAWLHMCSACNIRMEYCGTDYLSYLVLFRIPDCQ
jgi:hypothetical protein